MYESTNDKLAGVTIFRIKDIDGLVQERRNSSVLAME